MINKILCLFGKHEWGMNVIYVQLEVQSEPCGCVEYRCKHCGARR